MRHIKMFRAALATLAAVFAGGYAFAEETQVEDTPEVEETPAVTKVKWLKPKYTSTMTVEGYSGETELENFPVAVRISPDTISGFKYADCTGQDDITFTDANGNILPHEVEVWNTEGESVAWVSIPKLATVVAEDKTTYTTFKMNWGHETKLADTKSTEVWSAATFKGVWHMAQTSGNIKDSSGISRELTVVTTRSNGFDSKNSKIGTSFWVKSAEDNNGAEAVLRTTKGFDFGWTSDNTVSGWVNITKFVGTNVNPIGPYKKSHTYYWQLYPYNEWSTVALRFKGTHATSTDATLSPKKSGWFHYAVSVTKKGDFSLYINGEYSGSYKPTNQGYYKYGEIDRDYFYLYLCGYPGFLDETRIRNVSSSADWIKAEYDSINNKQFVVASEAVKNGYGLKIIVR